MDVELAVQAESEDFESIRKRMLEELGPVLGRLQNTARQCSYLDAYKQIIFYGKDAEVITVGCTPPTSIEIERVQPQKIIHLLHAAIGMATETGKFIESLLEYLDGSRPLDEVNLAEEIGDSLWYPALALDALKASLEMAISRIHLSHNLPCR